jgi:hypothetical protein
MNQRFTRDSLGLSMDGPKPNWTEKTDRTEKNRANPIARRFGLGFRFSLVSVSGRFGPNPTKTEKDLLNRN